MARQVVGDRAGSKIIQGMDLHVAKNFVRLDISEGEYARMSQSKGEKLSEYIVRMEDLGERLGVEEKRRFSYLLEGISEEFVLMKSHIVFQGKISSSLLTKIKVIEKDFKVKPKQNLTEFPSAKKKSVYCFICEGPHFTTSCPEHPY